MALTVEDSYDLSPLQAWFREHRDRINMEHVAAELGYLRRSGKGDTSRVLRELGLKNEGGVRGRERYRTALSFEKAARLARALGADPWEVQL